MSCLEQVLNILQSTIRLIESLNFNVFLIESIFSLLMLVVVWVVVWVIKEVEGVVVLIVDVKDVVIIEASVTDDLEINVVVFLIGVEYPAINTE